MIVTQVMTILMIKVIKRKVTPMRQMKITRMTMTISMKLIKIAMLDSNRDKRQKRKNKK